MDTAEEQKHMIEHHATETVSIKDLTVVYGKRTVLDIPSFKVNSGEVMGVIGPNGSGKTTLLLNLALLTVPTTGTVYYSDVPVTNPHQILALRRKTATVFQEPLLLAMSVLDNVTLGLKLRGVGIQVKERARKWLERFGVAQLENRSPRTLSGGEAKRVSLARAFSLEPEILFLDEPFTALDSPTRQALLEDFESVLRETKVTTVMVTHDRNEALVVAGRVAVLIGGKLRQLGTPDEVFNYPVDEQVAGFVETGNILPGLIINQNEGLAVIRIGTKEIEAVSKMTIGKKVTVCLRHEDVTLSLPSQAAETTSARNRFTGKITKIYPVGTQVRMTVDVGFPLVALITRQSWEEMGLRQESTVTATFKASSIHLI
jgi:tungstate transport system ATP-binding protein